MGKRGFQQKGYPNPLLERKRRKPPPVDGSGRNIKNYLARPRPTMDEVKKMIEEKESKSKTMYEFESQQSKDFRKELDKYRKKMMKRQAKKEKKELKKKKKEEKHKNKRKRDSSDDSPEDEEFRGELNDESQDEETQHDNAIIDNPSQVADNATTTPNPTMNIEKTIPLVSDCNNSAPPFKKSRWDEKPEVFKNLSIPTPPPTLPVYNTIIPTIPSLSAIPLSLHPLLQPNLMHSALYPIRHPLNNSLLPNHQLLPSSVLPLNPLLAQALNPHLLFNHQPPKQ